MLKKPFQVIAAADALATPETPPEYCSSMASGIRYMLATLCSNPAATKAEIGKMIAIVLSVTLRPASAIHTARQTKTKHNMPKKKTNQNGIDVLAAAIPMYS